MIKIIKKYAVVIVLSVVSVFALIKVFLSKSNSADVTEYMEKREASLKYDIEVLESDLGNLEVEMEANEKATNEKHAAVDSFDSFDDIHSEAIGGGK